MHFYIIYLYYNAKYWRNIIEDEKINKKDIWSAQCQKIQLFIERILKKKKKNPFERKEDILSFYPKKSTKFIPYLRLRSKIFNFIN